MCTSSLSNTICNYIISLFIISILNLSLVSCPDTNKEIELTDTMTTPQEDETFGLNLIEDMEVDITDLAENLDLRKKSDNIRKVSRKSIKKRGSTSHPDNKGITPNPIGDKPLLTDISNLPSSGQPTDFSFIGKRNSNEMYSLWKIEKIVEDYFYIGNTKDGLDKFMTDSTAIYCLFSEDSAYELIHFNNKDPYYLIDDSVKRYTFNSITNEIAQSNLQNGRFTIIEDNAYYSYFCSDDGKWYMMKLIRIDSLKGRVSSINEDHLKVKSWNSYVSEQLSKGDGNSEGSINLTINYNGNQGVSEQSPIVALLMRDDDNSDLAIAGNLITSIKDNKKLLTGIPDGRYYLFVIRFSDIAKSMDPVHGDIYTIYDGSYYGGPDPTYIEILGGSSKNISVDLDDTHTLPAESKGIRFCDLKEAGCLFDEKQIHVTVDLSTSSFNFDPSICAYLFSPESYRYNRARFDKGQVIELNLNRKDGTDIWEGTTALQDFCESGTWKMGMIQIDGIINNIKRLIGYTMEHKGIIDNTYWYNDWSEEEEDIELKTEVPVPEFTFHSSDPDTSGPELLLIEVDKSAENSVKISVTIENIGSSGHRMDDFTMNRYPVEMYLHPHNNVYYNIDNAYLLEFRDISYSDDNYATYTSTIHYSDLPEHGLWDIKAVQLIDQAGNISYYFIYDQDIYNGEHNFWGNEGTYSLFNFGPEYPVSTEIMMVTLNVPITPEIYVAGFYNMDSGLSESGDDEHIPCLWTNEGMIELDRGSRAYASPQSIFVTENHVYLAGYSYNGGDSQRAGERSDVSACLWRDDEILWVDENSHSVAYSVFVYGDKVYASGYYCNASSQYVACYWSLSNETVTRTDIFAGSIKSGLPTLAKSIYITDDIIHVAGNRSDGSGRKACYWKYNKYNEPLEEIELVMPEYSDNFANSIYVSGNDVYIAANYRSSNRSTGLAGLWLNGEQNSIIETLSHGVKDIYVSANDVFICGQYQDNSMKNKAFCCQISGENIEITDLQAPGAAKVHAIHGVGGDLYLSGCYNTEVEGVIRKVACYWKNDQIEMLTGYKDHNAEATDIFIME
ncbi:MAG: hypothetical protein SVZ03_07880 [Spirochaetota bacterium]|nr:hypothetical protein [Spirochaetota bacterium]